MKIKHLCPKCHEINDVSARGIRDIVKCHNCGHSWYFKAVHFILCPSCNNAVSHKADKCPACGHPLNSDIAVLKVLATIVFTLLILGACSYILR